MNRPVHIYIYIYTYICSCIYVSSSLGSLLTFASAKRSLKRCSDSPDIPETTSGAESFKKGTPSSFKGDK